MRRPERVIGDFRDRLVNPRQPAFHPQGADAVAPPGQDLVRIALVAHVPDQLVARGVEDGMQRHGQFHHPQPAPRWPPVTDTAEIVSARSSSASWCSSRSDRAFISEGTRPGQATGSWGTVGHGPPLAACPRNNEAGGAIKFAAAFSIGRKRRLGLDRPAPRPGPRSVQPQKRDEGRLAGLGILAGALAGGGGIAGHIQDVVGRSGRPAPAPRHRRARAGVGPGDDGPRLGRKADQRPGLAGLQGGDLVQRQGRAPRFRRRCPAPGPDHALAPRPAPAPQPARSAPRPTPAPDRSTARKPASARHRRPEPPSPRPISHAPSAGRGAGRRRPCRQVVMHQAIGVQRLDRRGGAERTVLGNPQHPRAFQHQKPAQPLAALHRIAHRVDHRLVGAVPPMAPSAGPRSGRIAGQQFGKAHIPSAGVVPTAGLPARGSARPSLRPRPAWRRNAPSARAPLHTARSTAPAPPRRVPAAPTTCSSAAIASSKVISVHGFVGHRPRSCQFAHMRRDRSRQRVQIIAALQAGYHPPAGETSHRRAAASA
jgi:hypothetical protein